MAINLITRPGPIYLHYNQFVQLHGEFTGVGTEVHTCTIAWFALHPLKGMKFSVLICPDNDNDDSKNNCAAYHGGIANYRLIKIKYLIIATWQCIV